MSAEDSMGRQGSSPAMCLQLTILYIADAISEQVCEYVLMCACVSVQVHVCASMEIRLCCYPSGAINLTFGDNISLWDLRLAD